MDRIKTALDKSRSRKQQASLLERQNVTKTNGEHPFENIEYTQTRHIDVSQNVQAENRLIAGNRSDPRATSFRVLRTQVLHAMRENNWVSVGVTGPTTGVGKTLVATNLAISISHEVQRLNISVTEHSLIYCSWFGFSFVRMTKYFAEIVTCHFFLIG